MTKGSNSGGTKGGSSGAKGGGSGVRPGTGGNWPSTTGRPSGGNRGNAPSGNKSN